MSLGNQEAPRSILVSCTSFSEDLVMTVFPGNSSSADSRRAGEAPQSILVSCTSFSEDLVMTVFPGNSSSADSRRAFVS